MVAQPTASNVTQLLSTAKALRQARRMQQAFLLQWALDGGGRHTPQDHDNPHHRSRNLFNHEDHDWKVLYRGSILDD